MEQTKNEPTKENKAAPETGKPKKEREPLTEAQRLKRQKMIVLPAMVLVFIGAMWLIFAPSSGKEQPPGTDGYNTEMPDADKANRQIIGDKLKAYEHGEMEERQESRNRAIGQLGDMFDREIAGTENGVDFDLANPGGKEERAKPATPQTIQSSAAAYRDLNATLGNFYDQPKNDNAEMDELLERIASLESELESERGKASSMDEHIFGGQVNDKLHILFQNRIGVPFRSDRNVTHRWVGTDCTYPRYGDNVIFFFTAATCNQGCWKRINHCTWFPVLLHGLQKFDVILLLFFFAVMALQQAFFLVDDVEPCLHRLVVGDTFRVVALHDASQLVRHFHFFLFYDFIVADDIQLDFGSNYRQAADFFFRKEAVGNFDDSLLA